MFGAFFFSFHWEKNRKTGDFPWLSHMFPVSKIAMKLTAGAIESIAKAIA
jgi:hypothetical protein